MGKELGHFVDYLDRSTLESGVKDGSLVVGKLEISRFSDDVAFLRNPLFGGQVQVVGHFDRNRALPEDLVVVRLRPRDQWTPRDIMNTPTPKIIPILTSVGQMLDDAATTTINDSFGVGVDPIARYTPPQLNSAMVARGDVVSVLSSRTKQELFCRIQSAKSNACEDGTVVLSNQQPKDIKPMPVDQFGVVVNREGQKFIRVVPVDPQFPCIEVPADSFAPEVHPNALVLVSLPENPWPISAPVPQGSIVEVRKATLQAEYDLILHELGMHSDFPEAVAQAKPPVVTHADWAYRTDLRSSDLSIMIEDQSAGMDGIDGAVSCRVVDVEGRQAYRIGVHILDVTHFLTSDSAIDQEAAVRSISLSMPDCTIPMVPPAIAGCCAIGNSGDTLAFSLLWTVTEDGTVLTEWMGKTVIRHWCSMSAQTVSKLLKGQATVEDVQMMVEPHVQEQVFASVTESIKQLYTVATGLRRARLARGGLTVRPRNVAFKFAGVSETAKVPIKVIPDTEAETEGQFVVEEVVMFTNHRVAQKLYAHLPHHWVAFSRIQPSAWKVAALCTAAKPRGIHVDGLSNNALKHLAAAVEGSKTPTAVGIQAAVNHMLWSSEYVCSSTSNGHLEPEMITHFTCPLRRYSDLVAHRLLSHVLEQETKRWDPSDTATSVVSCEKAGGYSVDQLKTLCTNFTEAISKQSKVQQTSLKACLSLYLRSLQKRDPYLSAVAYVVHLSPDAITVTIPAYGISEDVKVMDRHQRWLEVQYSKEAHSATLTWESGQSAEVSLLTAFEARVYYCKEGRSENHGVHVVLWDLLDETQKAKRRQNPQSARDHMALGEFQEMQQEYANAMASYTAALESDPPLAEAFVKRGDLRASQFDDTEGALKDFEAAKKCDAKSPAPYLSEGKLHSWMGNYVDALEQAMQAIMLAPTSSDAYYQRAAVYNSLRDRERAVADYNTVIQLDPTAAQAFYQRGCLHATKFNDYTAAVAAVADFTAVIELQPSHANAHSKRGDILYGRFHDIPRAVRDFAQAAALEPKNVHPSMFQSYQHMGFATEAEYYENRMNSEGLRACGDLRYRVHQILTSLGECQLFVQGLTLTGLSCKHDTLDLCLVPGYTGYAEWWASQGIKHSEYQTQFVTRMAAALAEQMDAGFEVQAGGSCPRVKAKTTTEAVPVVFTVCLDYSAVRISLLQQRYLTGWVQVVAFHLLQWSRSLPRFIGKILTPDTVIELLLYFLLQKRRLPFIDPSSIPATQPTSAETLWEACVQSELEYAQSNPSVELAFQIGKTVCDFFHFYHFEFDYAHRVVSISQPGVQYKKHKGWSDCFCVEDPYNPDFNVVSGITKQTTAAMRQCFAAAFDFVVEVYASTCGLEDYPVPAPWGEEQGAADGQDPQHEADDVPRSAPEADGPQESGPSPANEDVPPGSPGAGDAPMNGVSPQNNSEEAPANPVQEPEPEPPAPPKKAEPTAEELEILDILVKSVPARCRVTLKQMESTHWKQDRKKRFGPLAKFLARFSDRIKVEGALVYRPT